MLSRYREAVVAAARTALPAWAAAVQMREEVKSRITLGAEQMQAVDYYIAAAEALEGGNLASATLRTKAALVARELFFSVRDGLTHKLDGLRGDLRAVDQHVLELLTQRHGTEVVSANVLAPPESVSSDKSAAVPRTFAPTAHHCAACQTSRKVHNSE